MHTPLDWQTSTLTELRKLTMDNLLILTQCEYSVNNFPLFDPPCEGGGGRERGRKNGGSPGIACLPYNTIWMIEYILLGDELKM